jgi:hypothetical protein
MQIARNVFVRSVDVIVTAVSYSKIIGYSGKCIVEYLVVAPVMERKGVSRRIRYVACDGKIADPRLCRDIGVFFAPQPSYGADQANQQWNIIF